MKRTINVTCEDITAGLPSSPGACPIARACRRDLADILDDDDPLYAPASIGFEVMYLLVRGQGTRRVHTSETIKDFIQMFDRHYPNLQPFSFELEIPE